MSNTDSLSFAPNSLLRGGVQSNGKTSLNTAGAVDHLAATSWTGQLGQATTVTYAYRINGTVPDDASSGFGKFTAAQIAGAEKAMAAWADVANIHFTRVNDGAGYSDNATILFADYGDGPDAGFAFYPGARSASADAGDVWINDSLEYNQVPVIGDYGGQVFVHEIGHALGMSHPGDYNGSEDGDPEYATDAEYYEDSRQYTVMSYFPSSNTGASLGAFSGAPLLDDISAIQALYGANMTTRTGDTVYGFHSTAGREWYGLTNSSSVPLFSVWDAGGNDTLDFSGFSDTQRIDLRAGDFSDVGGWVHNVSIAFGATIENAIGGSGTDMIIGNAAGNVIDGGAGNDALYGEGGNDTLRGGTGDDLLDGGSGSNQIDGGSGNDTLYLPGLISDYRSAVVSGGYVISGNGITDTIFNIETIVTRLLGATTNSGTYSLAAFLTQTPGGAIFHAVTNDFNGDGWSDVLWRNVNGMVSTWQFGGAAHGNQIQQAAFTSAADPSWKIVETGDFDGNGAADLLWRNVNGEVGIWSAVGGGNLSPREVISVGNDWRIAAVGDLNGDGKADILWRNQDGSLTAWVSTGPTFNQGGYSHASVSNDWKVDALTDFNGDGRADILWRNDSGQVTIWQGAASGFVENGYSASVGLDWHVQGVGDFNGDGKSDILWRRTDGALTAWFSNGSGFNQGSYFRAGVGNDWQIAEVGDFNHDGRSDILWRNVSGAVTTWESNGTGFDDNIANGFVSNDWTIISHIFPL